MISSETELHTVYEVQEDGAVIAGSKDVRLDYGADSISFAHTYTIT